MATVAKRDFSHLSDEEIAGIYSYHAEWARRSNQARVAASGCVYLRFIDERRSSKKLR
jgi:hypothetical protein